MRAVSSYCLAYGLDDFRFTTGDFKTYRHIFAGHAGRNGLEIAAVTDRHERAKWNLSTDTIFIGTRYDESVAKYLADTLFTP